MKGFALYQAHNAFNLHFNQSNSYDYFKYHGVTNVKEDTFKKNSFRWQYAALENNLDQVTWFLFQMYKSNQFKYLPSKQLLFVGNKRIKSDDYFQYPVDYLNNVVDSDLIKLSDVHKGEPDLFSTGTMYPQLYEHYQSGMISLETLLLSSMYINGVFTSNQSRNIITWPQVVQQMKAVQPFVEMLFEADHFVNLFTQRYILR